MRPFLIVGLVVTLISPTNVHHHHVTPHAIHNVAHVTHRPSLVSPRIMAAWSRVYICETHNWKQRGEYEGGLGMTQWNWEHHGGLRFASAPYLATPEQQVYVATVIQHGLPVPDQTSTCKDW